MIYYTFLSSYLEYSFSIILINVFIYILLIINIFLIMFLFDLKYLKTLSDLKNINNVSFLSIFFVIILLSFAGIPPLLGFLSKFITFLFIFFKKNFIFVLIFLFINMFSIYFYVQNLRFLISKNNSNKLNIKNNNICLNKNLVFFLIIFNFINVFSIFYIEDNIIFFNFLTSFLFI